MARNTYGRYIIISSLLLLAAAALSVAARMVPGFAQWYAVTVYPALQGSIGRLSGLFPFSVAEMLCVLLPVVLLIDIVLTVRHCKITSAIVGSTEMHAVTIIENNSCDSEKSDSVGGCQPLLTRVLLVISILVFMYVADCGVNYYRDPFVDRNTFESAEFTEDELAEFCEYAVEMLSSSKISGSDIYENDLTRNKDTDSAYVYPSGRALADAAVAAMQKLSSDCSDLAGYYPRPKMLTFMSGLFSMMGVSGIYSPFTIEANVNGEMPGLELPFTACHELSHLRGFMNEGEANYIGWLACIGSDDPAFSRSGWIIAWIYAGNSLYRIDSDRYFALREKLPDDIIRELENNSKFWASHENKASEVQDKVNDAYLRSNGQDQGIRTYGQLTTLMLMWYTDSGSRN